jgi:hypothetical protein
MPKIEVTLSEPVLERLERERGLVPRSKWVARVIELELNALEDASPPPATSPLKEAVKDKLAMGPRPGVSTPADLSSTWAR